MVSFWSGVLMLWWNGVMKTWRREELCEDICEAQSTSTHLLQQWDAFHARHSRLFRRSTARQDTFRGFSHAVAHVSIRIDPLPKNLEQDKPLLVPSPKTRMRDYTAQQCFGRLAVTSRAQWWSSCFVPRNLGLSRHKCGASSRMPSIQHRPHLIAKGWHHRHRKTGPRWQRYCRAPGNKGHNSCPSAVPHLDAATPATQSKVN